MEKIYKTIENDRIKKYCVGPFYKQEFLEPREPRNAMASFLSENIKDGGVYVDLFSGDCTLPLALLYLSENVASFKKNINKIYVIDNESNNNLEDVRENAEKLGIEKKLVIINGDVCNPSLELPEPADACFLTDAFHYIAQKKYVKDPSSFFKNIRKFSDKVLASHWKYDFSDDFLKNMGIYYGEKKHGKIKVDDDAVYTLICRDSSAPN